MQEIYGFIGKHLYVRCFVFTVKHVNSRLFSIGVSRFYCHGSNSNYHTVYDLTLCILVVIKGFKNHRLGLGSSVLTLVVRFVARFTSPLQ